MLYDVFERGVEAGVAVEAPEVVGAVEVVGDGDEALGGVYGRRVRACRWWYLLGASMTNRGISGRAFPCSS